MNPLEFLASLFYSSGFFETKTEVRVLAQLIVSSEKVTVKQICEGTNMHNSKVYPALGKLDAKNLIQKHNTTRPHLYYFNDPETLNHYFMDNFDKQINEQQKLFKTIENEVLKLWNQPEYHDSFIGQVYRGKSINNEIIRIQQKSEIKLFYLLAPKFKEYATLVTNNIKDLLDRNVKVELAFPFDDNFVSIFEGVMEIDNPLLKIKSSVWENNSYIVSDRSIMLNITHGSMGNHAMLLNDSLWIDYMNGNWTNDACAVPYLLST